MDPFTAVLREAVDRGALDGAAVRITHAGRDLYLGCEGYADREAGRPFETDTVACVFSMTKMVIAVAALKLWEQGRFRLDDPVSGFLPEYGQLTVCRPAPEGFEIRPAEKPLTMRHLFTMTSGFPYPTAGNHPNMPAHHLHVCRLVGDAFEAYRARARQTGETITTRKAAALLASVPMCFEPGESWLYGHGSDILGAVVSEISGMSLAEFIRREITEPLGMKDTVYVRTEEQKTRTAVIYDHFQPGVSRPYDLTADARDRLLSQPTKDLEICSSSLWSTLDDYSRFIRMLCRGGTLEGARILGPRTVKLMSSEQLTPEQHRAFCRDWFPGGSLTWGLMTCVSRSLNQALMVRWPGSFGWSGAAGTVAWADPANDLSICFMTQRFPGDTEKTVSKLMQIAYSML